MIRNSADTTTMTNAYRDRIYGRYLSSRAQYSDPELKDLEPRRPYLCKLIKEHFPTARSARILDLGCGYGALVFFARSMGYQNVLGVDGSEEQVVAAAKMGIEGVTRQDLVQALVELPAEAIDAVVSFDVLEHFTRDELVNLVDQVFRVLRTGGRWIIHVPNGESPFFGRIRYGDLTHELAFTRISITQLMLASGFRSVACFEDEPIVHGLASFGRLIVWRILRAALRLYIAAETGDRSRAVLSQNILAVIHK